MSTARTIRRGDGYIEERITSTGDIRYQARWFDGTRWRAKTFASNDDAEDHLRDTGRSRRSGKHVADADLTITELVDEYLTRGRSRWTEGTYANYRSIARGQIAPHIGTVRVQDATPRRLQQWIDDLAAHYSPARIVTIRAVLRGAFGEGLRLGVIDRDPLAGVRMPRSRRYTHVVWSRADIAAVLAHVAGDPLMHTWYVVALTTGMRPGELRALMWGDVDLDAGAITVRRTMTRDADYRPIIGTTTKGGRERQVAVPDETVTALTTWRRDQTTRRIAHGAWQDTGIVFDRGDGQYLPQQTLAKRHTATCKAAGVPVCRPHDVRHAAATLLLEAGINLKVVSEMLGHRNITITADIYQHVDMAMQREAATSLGAVVGDKNARVNRA